MSTTKKKEKKNTKNEPAPNSKGRGIRIDEKIKSEAMIMLSYGDTVSYICDKLGLKDSTVRTWEKALKNNPEFVNFRDNIIKERRDAYLLEACVCQGKALKVMHQKLDNAIICEGKRAELIKKLSECNKDDEEKLSVEELKKAVTYFLPESLDSMVRACNILTEKVALLNGDATQNINHSGSVKFEDL